MIHVRPATLDDAQEIARVQVETWRSAYRGIVEDEILDAMSEDDRAERWLQILQRTEQATFVAETPGGEVAGFANGGPERDGRSDYQSELYAIYVLTGWQGKGVGRCLLSTFAGWLWQSGFETMLVWVLADNRCRRFYERLGGSIVETKEIAIGRQMLAEVAYGWQDLRSLL